MLAEDIDWLMKGIAHALKPMFAAINARFDESNKASRALEEQLKLLEAKIAQLEQQALAFPSVDQRIDQRRAN